MNRQQQRNPYQPYQQSYPQSYQQGPSPYGGGLGPWPPQRRRRRFSLVGLVFVVVTTLVPLGVAGVGVFYGLRAAGIFGAPDALTAEGLDGLREDVSERTGGTEVFEAVIYPKYAVVDLPVDDRSQREETVRWDGGLGDFGSTKGTADTRRFDLADVDAAVMVDAVDAVKALVDDPDTWYVIITGPSTTTPDGEGVTITAHASNDFSESAYVEFDLEGNEIRRLADGQVVESRP